MVLLLTSKERNIISFGCTFTHPTHIPVHKIGNIAPDWLSQQVNNQENMFFSRSL